MAAALQFVGLATIAVGLIVAFGVVAGLVLAAGGAALGAGLALER